MRQRWADYRVFWREFRQQYHTTGAVLPSGPALAKALACFVRDCDDDLEPIRKPSAEGVQSQFAPKTPQIRDSPRHGGSSIGEARPQVRRILEVGPGTGAVTGQILAAMRPGDRLFLVERNEQFVAQLQTRLMEDAAYSSSADRIAILHASVEDLPESEPYDLIISGLPLNNFDVQAVARILAKLRRLLAPGGTLSFFEYVAVRKAKSLISARDERKRLRGIGQLFEELLRHEIRRDLVLANVTPAWVHHLRFG